MSRTLAQVLSAAGPDDGALRAVLQLINFGEMCRPQIRTVKPLADAATFKLSDIDPAIPGVTAGSIANGGDLKVSGTSGSAVCVGTPAQLVDSDTGLTIGSSNAAVRVIAKPGFIVRYAQFSGNALAATGTGSRPSQGLEVFVTGKGKYCEIWVQLATGSGAGAISSTSAQVQAALLASADAMRVLATVDGNGGTGASTAIDSTLAEPCFNPSYGPEIAAGMTTQAMWGPGQFVASYDGNLVSFVVPISTAIGVQLQYRAAPAMVLDEDYPASA